MITEKNLLKAISTSILMLIFTYFDTHPLTSNLELCVCVLFNGGKLKMQMFAHMHTHLEWELLGGVCVRWAFFSEKYESWPSEMAYSSCPTIWARHMLLYNWKSHAGITYMRDTCLIIPRIKIRTMSKQAYGLFVYFAQITFHWASYFYTLNNN